MSHGMGRWYKRECHQGLTLVHCLAHVTRFLWDTLGSVIMSVTKAAQVELKRGRVEVPGATHHLSATDCERVPVLPISLPLLGNPRMLLNDERRRRTTVSSFRAQPRTTVSSFRAQPTRTRAPTPRGPWGQAAGAPPADTHQDTASPIHLHCCRRSGSADVDDPAAEAVGTGVEHRELPHE